MIAVAVEPTNRDALLGSLQLSFNRTVIGTAVRFDGKTTVFPERSLGAEAVRGLNQRDQQSCANRTDRRDLAEQFRGLVFLTLG